MTQANGPLAGTKVLDLTRVLAGPLCTMMLGDLGADVVKIESPEGDDTRAWGPPFAAGESAYFLGVNRNKRSVVLNLATEPGRRLLARLLPLHDVVVDNFRAGTLARWGFDEAWLEAHAPRAVRCSITGYGPDGPAAILPGYDFILQAESGLMSLCGDIDGEPMKYGVAIVDIATGLYACNAVLAALQARERSGRGQPVSVSLFETSLALLANVASGHLVTGREPARHGNGHPNIVPYRSYRTRDGSVAVAVGNDRQFERFAALLGFPEWASDDRFRTNAQRVEHRRDIDGRVQAALVVRDTAYWLEALRKAGIPCGRVNTVAQAMAQPQTAARRMVEAMAHPKAGALRMLRTPIEFRDTPTSLRHPPPLLGADTSEVLQELLGLAAAEVADLRAAGVLA